MGDTPFNERERMAAVAKAEAWTRDQAARLDTTPEEILAAIRRGWISEQIEDLPIAKAPDLQARPPELEGVPRWIDGKAGKRRAA